MSCGCGTKVKGLKKMVPGIRRLVRARAAACHLCRHANRDPKKPWSNGALSCSINGATIDMLVNGKAPCPKSRFPDEKGYVRRGWIRFYGVPFHERLLLLLHRRKPPVCIGYDGCGCIVRLKSLFSRVPLLRRLSVCKTRS